MVTRDSKQEDERKDRMGKVGFQVHKLLTQIRDVEQLKLLWYNVCLICFPVVAFMKRDDCNSYFPVVAFMIRIQYTCLFSFLFKFFDRI